MPPIANLQRLPQLMLERLEHQGLFTTGLFLEASETPTRRTYLADQIGASTNDINEWRDEARLLNLANFGSDEQRIFTQAGVIGLSDVVEMGETTFHDRVVEAADTLGQDRPDDLTIRGWYDQAGVLAEA
jgi:hypothetical protein